MTGQKKRENKLQLFLLKHQDYMTSTELASLMNTSTKTVYRLIKKINADFSNGNLIVSEKGRGYKLDYEKFMEQTEVINKPVLGISPSERRDKVTEELLLSSPKAIKISKLSSDYYVGDSTISSDEKVIAESIKKFDLKLLRKNRMLTIKGKEKNIRRAITELIQQQNIIDIDEVKSSKEFKFNRYDVLFVSEQWRIIEKKLGNIPYPYNVNIFSHLCIMISRSRKMSTKNNEENLTDDPLQSLDDDKIVRDIAIEIIRNVESYLSTKLPISEIDYLYQYMVSSRMGSLSKQAQKFTDEVREITCFYLEKGGKKLNVRTTNELIFTDLANHVKPMLNRLRSQIQVKNGLLDQIQLTYEYIFNSIAEVSKEVSKKFELPPISKDEIGFITLYFARIMETYPLPPIRTLIMCTTGVGTSELLKAKIAKKFPELDVVDIISTKDYLSVLEKAPDIELILTTVRIKASLKVKSLLVSAMLTTDDQSRIQRKMEEIYNEK